MSNRADRWEAAVKVATANELVALLVHWHRQRFGDDRREIKTILMAEVARRGLGQMAGDVKALSPEAFAMLFGPVLDNFLATEHERVTAGTGGSQT